MGQYFYIINLDIKEYINPHRLDCGLRLWEICANNIGNIIPFLLRQSSEGGGGDIQKDYTNAGRWAGDRIVVVGDYDDSKLYQEASEHYTEISKEIVEEWNDFIQIEKLKLKYKPK
mgnify:CR=1 FL=1